VIHQPAYSLLNRWIEDGLDEVLVRRGRGAIAFTALAQGLLTDRYLGDAPVATGSASPRNRQVSDDLRRRLRGLAVIAASRGQSLAQMALAWVLHNPAVVSTLIGVSSVEQLKENLAALDNLEFSDEEITAINEFAGDAGVNYWAVSAES
ncbi:MAG: aldo/keto reductase, partial [Mycetocola sp.]